MKQQDEDVIDELESYVHTLNNHKTSQLDEDIYQLCN